MKKRNAFARLGACLQKVCVFAALLCLSAKTASAQNAGVTINFDTPDQYVTPPTNRADSPINWANNFFPNGIGEKFGAFRIAEGGVGPANGPGSGALDLRAGGNDQTSTFLPYAFDFSQNGTTLKATALVKIRANSNNNRAIHMGFVTSTNAGGINGNNGQGFMTAILQARDQPASNYELQQQSKPISGTATTATTISTATPAAIVQLFPGNWYKVTATFVNIKDTTANSYTLSISVEDMGSDGLTPSGTVIATPAPVSVTQADLVNSTKLYFALRGFETTGVDLVDNITIESSSGALAVQPLAATTTVAHGSSATLYARATGDGPYTYQWNRGATPIPGATSFQYTLPKVSAADNGATYSVTVTSGSTSVTSGATTLAVTANPLAVTGVGSVDGAIVGVRFNQQVDKATAETLSNYQINGTAPRAATLLADGVSVILNPFNVLTAPYTVSVSNVRDFADNVMTASVSNGRVEGFSGMDVNNASPAGSNYSFGPGQFDIVGGGADIWNQADQFRFVYKTRTGDFDVFARIPYMDIVRAASKVGFDVRDSLAPQAIQVLAAVNPSFPGRNRGEGTVRQSYNIAAVSWGNATDQILVGARTYPNVWLRLRRTANIFTRYLSTDGVNWTFDGQVTVPLMPQTVYFGLAVCSVANGEPLKAVFENYQELTPAASTITMVTQPAATAAVNAGSAATITLAATWSGTPTNDLQVVWQRSNGSGSFTNIPTAGAGGSFNTGNLFLADSGAQYRAILRAPGATDVISDVTTVTVTDTAGATATPSVPSGSLYHINVAFNEPVDATTALNKDNYTVVKAGATPQTLTITSVSFASPDQRTVVLQMSSLLTAGDYTVSVSNVKDSAGNTMAPLVNRTISQIATPPTQPVVVEMYNNITTGTAADLEATGKFAQRIPDFIFYQNTFAFQVNLADTGWNNYGMRAYTYFVPSTTASYRFWMASDDSAILYMNTNQVNSTDALEMVELGRLNAFTGTYTTMAQNVALTAGQKYYIEVRLKEGTGGDGFRVMARTDATAPGAGDAILAANLAFPVEHAPATPVVSEIYTGTTGSGLAELDTVVNTAAFRAATPNILTFQKDFAANRGHQDSSRNDYLGRLYTIYIPETEGLNLYRLWVRHDDATRIYMNTNDVDSANPAGMVQIANRAGSTTAYVQVAQNIPLRGGQRYYLEARYKEGTGGDGFTLKFMPQDDPNPPFGGTDATTIEVEPGTRMEFPYASFTALGPVQMPAITANSPSVTAGSRVTLTVGGTSGSSPSAVTWYKNGVQVYGNSPTFTTEPLSVADDGATITAVVSNSMGTVVRNYLLSVTSDSGKPVLNSATSSYLNTIALNFSEALDRQTATFAGNYVITPSLAIVNIIFDEVNANNVTLVTAPLAPGQAYNVAVSGLKDRSGSNTMDATSKTVSGWATGGEGLLVEVFTGPTGGSVFGNLFQDGAFMGNRPALVGYTPEFGWGTAPETAGTPALPTSPANNFTGSARDNYGARVTGLFLPPSTGYYRFFIRGDDETRLFMNTNGPSPSGAVSLARNSGANSSTFLNGNGDSQNGVGNSYTPLIFLNAGTEYFIQAYLKENTGGDYVNVAFRKIDDIANDNPRDPNYVGPVRSTTGGVMTEVAPGEYFRTFGNPDLGPITFPQTPPATLQAIANAKTELVVNAQMHSSLRPASTYQWQKLNTASGNYENLDGQTASNLVLYPTLADAGQYRVIVRIPTADRVYDTTLTVTADNVAPTLASIQTTNRLDRIYLTFSEPINPINNLNIQVSGGPGPVTVQSVEVIDAVTALITTSELASNTTYTVTALNITDRAGLTTPTSAKTFQTRHVSVGFWTIEYFDNVSGTDVAGFVSSNARFLANQPDVTQLRTGAFSAPSGRGDNYGARMTTLFTAPETGDYNFFTRVDDQLIMWISTDDKPERLVEVVRSTGACCQPFLEVGNAQTTAAPIHMEEGKRYLMVVVFKEGTGGDFAEVAYRIGDAPPAAGSLTAIPAQYLSLYVDPAAGSLQITQQPQSQTVLEGRSANLTVAATSPNAISYQWQQNTGSGWVNVAGATTANFTSVPLTVANTGIKYRAVVNGYGITQISGEATITVTDDSTGPVAVSAGAFTGGSVVGVKFNELLDEAQIGTYAVSGTTVQSAQLYNGKYVKLTLAGPVAAGYTVTITGARDQNGNTTASGVINGVINDLSHQNLGSDVDPIEKGDAFTWGTGYYVAGGGFDIWGSADAGYIVYKQVTGAFDVRARIESLVGGDEWGKAMLVARESLAADARNQGVLFTKPGPFVAPTTGGMDLYNLQWRDIAGGDSASLADAERIRPSVFNSWIRLVRTNATTSTMQAYVSKDDGQTWTLLGTHTTPQPPLPETLYVGMAVTSHDNTAGFPKAEVIYESFSITSGNEPEDPEITSITRNGGDITIEWTGGGTLQSAPEVTGPWDDIDGATTGSYTTTATGDRRFFQVARPQ